MSRIVRFLDYSRWHIMPNGVLPSENLPAFIVNIVHPTRLLVFRGQDLFGIIFWAQTIFGPMPYAQVHLGVHM